MIELFRVAVHVGMTTNSAQVLAAMLTQLTGIHVGVGKVESALSKMRLAVLGVGAAFVGWEALKILTKLTEKGIEFNQQIALMKMANFAPSDIKALETQAYETMRRVPGSNLNDIIKNLVDLRNISGSAEHATRLSEVMERTNLVMANVTGKPAGEQGYKFAKFLEDSGRMMDPKTGLFSEARVEQQSKLMQAVITGMRGRVSGSDLFQLRQSGKASVNALSDQGLINLLPAIQSLGPVAVGTALQGAQQQLLGAVQLRTHTVEWLKQYNLLDPTKIHKARGGLFKMDPGAIRDEQTLMHDLTGWIWNTVLPKMMAPHKDYTGKMVPGLELEGVLNEIRRSGLRTPLLGFMAEVIQNRVTQQKELENVERSRRADTFKVMDIESPTFRITKFLEAWGNFTIALGKTVDVTTLLAPLTRALNWLTEVVLANPPAAQNLMEFAAGVATVLALGGAIGVFALLIRPFVTAIKVLTGIQGLATTATGLTTVATGLGTLGASVAAFVRGLSALTLPLALKGDTGPKTAPAPAGQSGNPNIPMGQPGAVTLPDLYRRWAPSSLGGSSPYVPPPLSHGPKGEILSDAGESRRFAAEVGNAVKMALNGVSVRMDGRVVGQIVSDHQADQMNRPPTGSNSPDVRVGAIFGGQGGNWALA